MLDTRNAGRLKFHAVKSQREALYDTPAQRKRRGVLMGNISS
jgi:hypothetical protein